MTKRPEKSDYLDFTPTEVDLIIRFGKEIKKEWAKGVEYPPPPIIKKCSENCMNCKRSICINDKV
jgi:hypothetical protein